jgi:hypothetical protein
MMMDDTIKTPFPEVTVCSVQEYIKRVMQDTWNWKFIAGRSPWFRGQSDADKPPLPGWISGDIILIS